MARKCHEASPAAILAGAYIAKSFINDYNSKSWRKCVSNQVLKPTPLKHILGCKPAHCNNLLGENIKQILKILELFLLLFIFKNK